QVDPLASPPVIGAAFRALLRQRHPDVSADPLADQHTRRLLEVYRALSHPASRAAYDGELRRRAARLADLERLLAPAALDAERRRLSGELALAWEEYERWSLLIGGPDERRALERLDRLYTGLRITLRGFAALAASFEEGATQVVTPSGLVDTVGGYLAALDGALERQCEAAARLLGALRREHGEEIAAELDACRSVAEREEAQMACFRPGYTAAQARGRYLAAALG
ncbi:MAG: DnaJ domain-containing protein, partial [Chloroflexi bacterium]|nr:DnaJ domain-containing protein [Chloroflexota bacterium]